jgi:hypothetical protein
LLAIGGADDDVTRAVERRLGGIGRQAGFASSLLAVSRRGSATTGWNRNTFQPGKLLSASNSRMRFVIREQPRRISPGLDVIGDRHCGAAIGYRCGLGLTRIAEIFYLRFLLEILEIFASLRPAVSGLAFSILPSSFALFRGSPVAPSSSSEAARLRWPRI